MVLGLSKSTQILFQAAHFCRIKGEGGKEYKTCTQDWL